MMYSHSTVNKRLSLVQLEVKYSAIEHYNDAFVGNSRDSTRYDTG